MFTKILKTTGSSCLLLSVFFLVHCSKSAKTNNNASQATESNEQGGNQSLQNVEESVYKELNAKSMNDLRKEYEQRRIQNNTDAQESETLGLINEKLCSKRQSLKQNCIATVSIIPNPNDVIEDCKSTLGLLLAPIPPETAKDTSAQDSAKVTAPEPTGTDQATAQAPKGTAQEQTGAANGIQVALPNVGGGSYKIIINDAFESIPFSEGVHPITFSTIGASDNAFPQFLDAFKIIIKAADGSNMPPKELFQGFSLNVNGQVLVNEIKKSSDSALEKKQYDIGVAKIIESRNSSQCVVKPSEIDLIKAEATTVVKKDYAAKMAWTNKNHATTNKNYSSTAEALPANINKDALIGKIAALMNNIADRAPVLEKKRNTLFKLTSDLKTKDVLGCHYNKPITSFEIEIEGERKAAVSLGNFSTRLPDPADAGKSSVLQFKFGSISITIDQDKENLFGQHYTIKDNLSNFTIGSLQYVEISKQGVSYDQRQVNDPSGFLDKVHDFFTKSGSEYEVDELNVFNLSSVKIFANGKPVYSRSGLNEVLRKEKLKWTDLNLRQGPEWIKLMTETDCEETH